MGWLVDTHCHFDLYPDPRQVLRETEDRHIYSIAVTNTPSVFPMMKELAAGCRYVRPALGLHPELAAERAAEVPLFARLLPETRYVGEVGLDYRTAAAARDRVQQRTVFASILRHCAAAGGRILTIHSRRAEADVIAAVREHQPGPFILHWYSGSHKTLHQAVDAGAFFSVNPAMMSSDKGRGLVAQMPRDRVLTESDGPFIRTATGAATPASTSTVCEQLGALWTMHQADAQHLIWKNFQRLLKGFEGRRLST
jgi:TatD DNase family protein